VGNDGKRAYKNPYVTEQAPVCDILKIGLQSIQQVGFDERTAPETPNLREARQPRFDGVAIPVAFVDIPKQRLFGARPAGMWSRADKAHASANNVEKLWKLVNAGPA
jgi:hypothetical protein